MIKVSLNTQGIIMKTSKIILSLGILLLASLPIRAQTCECPEVPVEQTTTPKVMGVNDYTNFLTIEGLKKYSNIKYEGIDKNLSAKRFILSSKNNRTSIYAIYGTDGNLLRARLVTKNVRLPKAIQHYLVTNDYRDWTMTSNKVIVHDFDRDKTEFEVIIQRDNKKQKLLFDNSGIPIEMLSRS